MSKEEIRKKLTDFICTELLLDKDYSLSAEEPLITNGLIDSFALAQIAVFVEKAFDIYIPDTDLTVENLDTVDQMTALIYSMSSSSGQV